MCENSCGKAPSNISGEPGGLVKCRDLGLDPSLASYASNSVSSSEKYGKLCPFHWIF